MLRDSLPVRSEARRILFGTIFSSLGRGFTLPFLFVYLTQVRDISGSTAGLLIGWFGLLTLIIAPLGGTLIDRFGARRVVMPALVLEAIAMALLGVATTSWQFWAVLTLGGLGGSTLWAGQNTILSSLTTETERQKVFGLQFALLNLGIGVGAAVSGTIVDITRPGTFQLIYTLDAFCYLAPFLVLLTMPHVGHRLVKEDIPKAEQKGWLEVIRHRPFRRLMAFSIMLTLAGYAQLEVGFTGFALNVVGSSPQIIGYAFTANTIVIVVAQLLVIKKLQGHSRTAALASVGVIFAISWGVLGLAGLVDGRSALLSSIGVVAFSAIFAFGETLLSPTLPTVVNALATDELRGRYNAASGMVWGISGVIAPVSAGPLMEHGLGGLWIGLVVVGCLVASVLALSLRRLMTSEQDGRESPSDDMPTPAEMSAPERVPA